MVQAIAPRIADVAPARTFTQGGMLQFACNYPGHADLGMEGKITVQ
jgi:plastocyanin